MNKKIIKDCARKAEQGFTLIEVLVAIAIVGIMAAVAVQSVTGHIAKANNTAARQLIQTINQALTTYSLDHHGKYPDALVKLTEGDDDNPPLIEGGEDALNDPWGTPIKYERKGKRVYLTSAGEDTEFGTEDDISNIDKKK